MITIPAIFLAVFAIGRLAIFLTSADSAGSEAVKSSPITSGQLFDHGSVARNNPDLSALPTKKCRVALWGAKFDDG